jgi:hypothetical protein
MGEIRDMWRRMSAGDPLAFTGIPEGTGTGHGGTGDGRSTTRQLDRAPAGQADAVLSPAVQPLPAKRIRVSAVAQTQLVGKQKPNQAHLTEAALLILRDTKVLQAAPAGELCRL